MTFEVCLTSRTSLAKIFVSTLQLEVSGLGSIAAEFGGMII